MVVRVSRIFALFAAFSVSSDNAALAEAWGCTSYVPATVYVYEESVHSH